MSSVQIHTVEESEQWKYLGCSKGRKRRRRRRWLERGGGGGRFGRGKAEGDEADRGGSMVNSRWVWSLQVEECVLACSITRNRWCECLYTDFLPISENT